MFVQKLTIFVLNNVPEKLNTVINKNLSYTDNRFLLKIMDKDCFDSDFSFVFWTR